MEIRSGFLGVCSCLVSFQVAHVLKIDAWTRPRTARSLPVQVTPLSLTSYEQLSKLGSGSRLGVRFIRVPHYIADLKQGPVFRGLPLP